MSELNENLKSESNASQRKNKNQVSSKKISFYVPPSPNYDSTANYFRALNYNKSRHR